MKRRLWLAAALGLVAASLSTATPNPSHIGTPVTSSSCDQCRADCNLIPMHPDDCIQQYCPECATVSTAPVDTVRDGDSVRHLDRP